MPPVARIYSCASGCGFTSDDPSKLRKCSKCKLAHYCCRDHQVSHWKAAHKAECFPPEAHAKQAASILLMNKHGLTITPEAAHSRALSALGNLDGISLFLGTTTVGQHVIVTDFWSTDDQDWGNSDEQVPPDLYLSHIPPALFGKAEDTWRAKPKISMIDVATHRLCHQFSSALEALGASAGVQRFLFTKEFGIAFKAAFTEERFNEAVLFIRELLQSVDWTLQIPVPARTQGQAKSLVGKPLSLEGGIEMVYLTEPVPCFADLTKSQMDWFNKQKWPCPMIKSPIVVYRCVEEGWVLARVNPRLHYPLTLDPATHFTSSDMDAISFKAFVAAAEFGDVAAVYAAWRRARSFAMDQKQEVVFIDAAHKLLQCLVEVHPHPLREEAYFLHDIGEVHESRASWLIRAGQDATGELLSAARCYYIAAMKTHQFSPNQFLRFQAYNSLGAALERLGDFEMAKRAYLWALTDASARMDPSVEGSRRDSITTNLMNWYNRNLMTPTARKKAIKTSLKIKRSKLKNQHMSENKCRENCRYPQCRKFLLLSQLNEKRCANCLAMYCSRECQEAHWPEHKKECKPGTQDDSTSKGASSMDTRFGPCSDATKELLDAVNWAEMKSTMSISEGARRVDELQQARPDTEFSIPDTEFSIPNWMTAELSK